MMRIITGKAKGVRLKTLEGEATRPTAERVKEAVFSMLAGDIEGREVLDLFSGSGQMALEALSRGAERAVMVDKSAQAVKIISDNAQKTKLILQCDIKNEDYLSFIRKNAGKKFDIIFIDPPYASGFYCSALNEIHNAKMLKPTTVVVCESGDGNILSTDGTAERFELIKQARYGKTYISILAPKEV